MFFFPVVNDVSYVTGIMNVWRNCIKIQLRWQRLKRSHSLQLNEIANKLLWRNERTHKWSRNKKCVSLSLCVCFYYCWKTSFKAMQVSSTFGFIPLETHWSWCRKTQKIFEYGIQLVRKRWHFIVHRFSTKISNQAP